uniref:Uncharacterized protein n=1 Tax=Cucumis melo TaxID=3656 RepID=A0A9I9EGQ0_CUCME
MIYDISIDYMTEILSLRLEDTVCTQVEIEFPVPDRLPESAEAPISIASLLAESVISGLHFMFHRVVLHISKFITLMNSAESTDIGREKRCRSASCHLSILVSMWSERGCDRFGQNNEPVHQHAVFGDARYLAIASCLVDGFHWSTTSNRQTGRESGMLSWSYLDLLAWIMLAPCCGYILDVLVHDDTRCLAIASCLVEGFGRN